MPAISSGSNATITVAAGQILTVQADQAEYIYENPVGTRIGQYGSDQTFGPFTAAGSVKVTSVQGALYYEVATAQTNDALYVPSNVAITGGVIGGVLLSSMGAPSNGGRIAGWLGDSITNGSTATNSVYAFPRQTMAMIGALRLSYANSVFAGVSGERSDQIALRLATVLSQGATTMFILAGTNDVGQSIPVATYILNMTGVIQACRKGGVPCFVSTVPPRGAAVATSTTRQLTDGYNNWLRAIAPTLGATVVDVWAALADPTTGDMLAAYDSGDGVHPNNLGHRKIAVAITAKLLASGISQAGMVQAVSSYNLVGNPLMAGAGSTPTGYFEQPGGTGTAPTYSIVSDTSGFLEAGRWAQMAFNATAGGTRILATALGSGWSVGDVLAVTGKTQIVDTGGNWESIATTALTAGVSTKVVNQSGVALSGQGDANGQSAGYPSGGNYNIGPNWSLVTVPVGTTSLILYNTVLLPTGANINARFGALGVINLTTLGLTAVN